MDLNFQVPRGRRVVEAYGEGGFRISGEAVSGSVLVFPTEVLAWAPATLSAVDPDALAPILARAADLDLLLIGCGPRMEGLAPMLRQSLRAAGLGVETMDTGAACRTYNVLIQEDRRVAAALIAV
ncbi:Mth938-like domain-containing protein [Pararhodospirillum photometricum]|uniref:Uncharacterized protein n=1 Tax=Pararhodospirillum photometricum DSM 122 TaxID=1150469 RepID=H6SQ50_PARPM|nr:Mth938-like domain-containing protein [Pararhodospirillum photometricum]CCG09569.1 Putative uncharacterized protein [Pararhodospirillum photometricum DSM 122]